MKSAPEIEEEILKGTHGIAVKILFEYNKSTLPELENLADGYNKFIAKFLEISERFISDTRALNSRPTQHVHIKQEPTVQTEIGKNVAPDNMTETQKILEMIKVEQNEEFNGIKPKKIKKPKRVVKKKKSKKVSEIAADTTAEMVRKNQSHISTGEEISVEMTMTVAKKRSHGKVKKTKEAKKVSSLDSNSSKNAKLNKIKKKSSVFKKKKKRSDLKQNDLGSLGSHAPVPIGNSTLASIKPELTSLILSTPGKKAQQNLQAIIDSANKKTITNKARDDIKPSGTVKKLIEMAESRAKTPHAPSSVRKQAAPSGSVVRNLNLLYSNSKKPVGAGLHPPANNKPQQKVIDNPIDKRKERLSSRIDAKRQSVKNVNAFLKEIDCVDHNESDKQATVPKRLVNLSNNPSIKSNYKIMSNVPTSTKLTHNPSVKRKSFIKFLERNTPNKLTNTELKLDLKSREEQNQKRLEERDKLRQEKIEISKKKREEKMKKINDIKAKKAEEDLRRQEEIDLRQKEAEENKRRQMEEKRKEKEMKEHQMHHTTISAATAAHKPLAEHSKPVLHPKTANSQVVRNETFKQQATAAPNNNTYEPLSSFKSHQQHPAPNKNIPSKHNYVLPQIIPEYNRPIGHGNDAKAPLAIANQNHKGHNDQEKSKVNTPIKPKTKTYDDYNINDLNSSDETDDEEQPSKPIPLWAKNPQLQIKAQSQAYKLINFTKLFQSSSNYNIVLEDIFKIKRKNFTERSSSAIWNSPPVWRTGGLTGDESFRRL